MKYATTKPLTILGARMIAKEFYLVTIVTEELIQQKIFAAQYVEIQ